jgi:hypothetical protein
MIKKFEQFVNEIYNKHCINWISLNESQESKSQSAAIKLVMNNFGWDYQKADKFVREDLRNEIDSLKDKQIGKFTLGVARMYCNGELNNSSVISNLNVTLKLLIAHMDEYDRNLNGLSADELIFKFKTIRKNNISKEKEEINRMKFDVSDYEIVKIDSFSDAKKYYKYTNPYSRWCLTYMENMFDSYSCDGINQIYFCLKNGFEDIKPIVGENVPLDEYGLSMLSIIVNEEGELVHCTSRWNHDNGGNDSVMDAVEISKVVNVDFYETFKPNNKWKELVQDILDRLKNGENPEVMFDYCGKFNDGYVKVKLKYKYKYNFIDTEGNLLSPNRWFDDCWDFKDGYGSVKLNNKYNFIDTEGNLLSPNQWFDDYWDFKDGYARVKLEDKGWNFIDIEGNILSSNQWFNWCGKFNSGYGRVKLKDKGWNFIDTEGNILSSNQWFDDCENFNDGYASVKLNDKYNFIDTEGNLYDENKKFIKKLNK